MPICCRVHAEVLHTVVAEAVSKACSEDVTIATGAEEQARYGSPRQATRRAATFLACHPRVEAVVLSGSDLACACDCAHETNQDSVPSCRWAMNC